MHLTYVEHVVFEATHEWHILSESPIVELGLFNWNRVVIHQAQVPCCNLDPIGHLQNVYICRVMSARL